MERFDLLGLADKIESDLGADSPSNEDIHAVLAYLWSQGVDLRPARQS